MGESGVVSTVLGPVPADRLGHVQTHEHLLCDLTRYLGEGEARDDEITLENLYETRVDRRNRLDMRLDDVATAAAELAEFRTAGGGTIVEATSRGLGRDPSGLREIAERTGVHIVMGSGYYTAAFHPPTVATMTEEDIAKEIVGDILDGVDGTGVRAGVIGEIGLSWPPHPDEVKVLKAAAVAQSETGAALLIHPGRHVDAPREHLNVVVGAGGDAARTVMSHIDRTLTEQDDMRELADTGCVLEFDLFGTESAYYPQDPGFDMPNDGTRVRHIRELIASGYGDRVVIAQDVCRRTQLRRHGGEGYTHILRRVLPLMLARGLDPDDIRRLTRTTPARLLSLTRQNR